MDDASPPWAWPRAAYVHVPFCAHHCGYCDFAVAVGQDHLDDCYLDALAAELATLGRPQPVDTLFLGGGTPTHLVAGQLDRLLTSIRRWLPLQSGRRVLRRGQPRHARRRQGRRPGRPRRQPRQPGRPVVPAAPAARCWNATMRPTMCRGPSSVCASASPAVSLDLIFGVPGQTAADWRRRPRTGAGPAAGPRLDLRPDLREGHAAVEAAAAAARCGRWTRTRSWPCTATAIDALEAAGFEHYEISNFARPGRRCRHNQVYWANEAYFGFGMGAARYVRGRRELNTRDLHDLHSPGAVRRAGDVPVGGAGAGGASRGDDGGAAAAGGRDRPRRLPHADGVRFGSDGEFFTRCDHRSRIAGGRREMRPADAPRQVCGGRRD